MIIILICSVNSDRPRLYFWALGTYDHHESRRSRFVGMILQAENDDRGFTNPFQHVQRNCYIPHKPFKPYTYYAFVEL